MKKLQILIIAFLISLSICAFASMQAKAVGQYQVTFSSSVLGADATGNLVSFSVSGGSYSGATSPIDVPGGSILVDDGATVIYSFVNPVASTFTGEQYRLDSVTGSTSPITVTGDTTVTGNYVAQYLLTDSLDSGAVNSITASPTGDSWYDSGTTVIVVLNNVWDASSSTRTNLFSYTVDSTPTPVTRSNTGTVTVPDIVMSAAHSISDASKTQYLLTVTGGNGITYGTASPTGDQWYDSGTSTTVSSNWVWGTSGSMRTTLTNWNLDGGSNQNPARANSGTLTTSSVAMSAAHTVNFISTMQYYLTVTGGNSITYGAASPTSDNWYDSGTFTTVSSNGIYNRASGTGTRVSSWNIDSGSNTNVATTGIVSTSSVSMSTYHTVNFNTVTQYQVTLDTGATSALSSITSPTISGDNYWYDSGTTVTIALNGVYGRGSGAGTRITGYELNSGSNNPESTTGTFNAFSGAISNHEYVTTATVTQYQVTLDSGATLALNSITTPTISGDNYWYDSGTSVTLVLNGVYGRSGGSGTRISGYKINAGSNNPESTTGAFVVLNALSISSAQSITTTTVTQFFLTVTGGNGITYGAAPTISGDTGWYDSGTSTTVSSNWVWNIVAGQSRTALTNYAIDSTNQNPTRSNTGTLTTSSISMTTFHTVAFALTTQYYLSVSGGNGVSYGTASPTNDNWYDSGSSTTVSSNWEWNVVSGQSRTAINNYAIDGSNQNPARQGSGTLTTSSIIMSTYHTVVFASTTQYYLMDATISGSEYSITASQTNDGWYDSGTNVYVVLNNVWGVLDGSRSNLVSYTVDTTTTMVSRSGSGTVSVPAIMMSAAHSVSDAAQTQYQLTLSYSVSDGGSGYSAPSFTANQFGSLYGQTLTTSAAGYWFDAGSSWTETNPLGGSGGTERWQTNQAVSGSVSSAQTLAFVYYHQYQVTFAVSPSGSGSTSPAGANVWEAASSLGISATANSFYVFSNWTSSTGSITFSNATSASTTATISGSGVITGNFSPVSDHFFFNQIGSQIAGTSFTVTITDEDSSGGTITSYSGTPTFTYSAGSVTPSSATGGFSNGVWTGSVTVTVAGSGVTITATDGSHTGTSNSFTVNHAVAVANVVISPAGSSVTAGASKTYSATASDAYGNTWDVTSSTTWSISSSAGGSWSSNVYTSATAGAWTVTGTYASTAYTAGLTVNPAGLDHFVFNAVAAQTAGSAFSITVTAVDAYGNTVTGYTGTPSLTVSAGSISPGTMNAFVNGVGSTTVTVTTAGSSVTITATDGGHSVTSNSFTVTAAPTPTPTATPSPSPTATPTPTPTPTPIPTATPTPTIPLPTQTPSATLPPAPSLGLVIIVVTTVAEIIVIFTVIAIKRSRRKPGNARFYTDKLTIIIFQSLQ